MARSATNTQGIEIKASKENVWKVLTDSEFAKVWFDEFAWGGKMETDWKVGSPVYFMDESGQGLKAVIVTNITNEQLIYEYECATLNNKELPDDPETEKWKGLAEGYKLAEENGVTILISVSEFPEEYKEAFEGNWDAPLQLIKELAETIQELENEGFSDFSMCNFGPGFDSGEHTHDEHTVHVIVDGELTIVDDKGEKVYESGEIVEFPAGTKHIAKSGKEDFAMIVGTKK